MTTEPVNAAEAREALAAIAKATDVVNAHTATGQVTDGTVLPEPRAVRP